MRDQMWYSWGTSLAKTYMLLFGDERAPIALEQSSQRRGATGYQGPKLIAEQPQYWQTRSLQEEEPRKAEDGLLVDRRSQNLLYPAFEKVETIRRWETELYGSMREALWQVSNVREQADLRHLRTLLAGYQYRRCIQHWFSPTTLVWGKLSSTEQIDVWLRLSSQQLFEDRCEVNYSRWERRYCKRVV